MGTPPDLLPQHAIRIADETVHTRLRRFVLSLSTMVLALFLYPIAAPWGESPLLLLRFGVYVLIICFIFALVSYAGSEALARYEAHRRLRRIFAGDPAIVPAPPADATHRLVCAALVSQAIALPGILYVQPMQLLFQPHRIPAGGVIPEPVPIGPAATITLDSAYLVLTRIGRWLWKSPPELLVVRWSDGYEMVLRVPYASAITPALQAQIDRMRAAAADTVG